MNVKLLVHPADKLPQIVGWADIQRQYEWYSLIGRVVRPASFLEIGVAAGYSSYAILEGCESAGGVPAVTWVDWCDGHGRDGNRDYALGLIRGRFGIDVDDRVVNSREIQSFHHKFDLIHVDGDHSYDGCLHDVYLAGRHLNHDGCILFHDTNDPNVSRAIDDFMLPMSRTFNLIEFPQLRCGGKIIYHRGSSIGPSLRHEIAISDACGKIGGFANVF